MKCDFCGREVEQGTTECPYCHYRFKIDAQVLTPDERDTFDGVTIEEDGSTVDTKDVAAGEGYGSGAGYGERGSYGDDQGYGNVPPGIKVHTYGCGSGILMTLLSMCVIVSLIFFLMPAYIVFAAIGAAVVFLLRLFM